MRLGQRALCTDSNPMSRPHPRVHFTFVARVSLCYRVAGSKNILHVSDITPRLQGGHRPAGGYAESRRILHAGIFQPRSETCWPDVARRWQSPRVERIVKRDD